MALTRGRLRSNPLEKVVNYQDFRVESETERQRSAVANGLTINLKPVAESVRMLTPFDGGDGSSYRNSNRPEQARTHTHRVFILDQIRPSGADKQSAVGWQHNRNH